MTVVVRRKATGEYRKGKYGWTSSLERAKTWTGRNHASNHLTSQFTKKQSVEEYDILEVNITLRLTTDEVLRREEEKLTVFKDALEEGRQFVDSHSEEWYTSGQEILEKMDKALSLLIIKEIKDA